jgi:hypothetical protein
VIPTDNLEVEGVITHYCAQENHLDDAAITLIYGGSHYQIAVPTCLPKSVEVTTSDSPELVPVISLSEDEDEVLKAVSQRRKWEKFTRGTQKIKKTATEVQV